MSRISHRQAARDPFVGVSRRLLAWVFDVTVLAVLVFIGASVVAAVFGRTVRFHSDATTLATSVTLDTAMVVANALVATSLSGAYFGVLWAVLGASPGQLVLGMQVRNERDGGKLSPGRAVARWILLFPPFGTVAALTAGVPAFSPLIWVSALIWYLILLVTTARSATKQGLHDRIVRSVVRERASAALCSSPNDQLGSGVPGRK